MAHPESPSLVWEILSDFPVAVVLQRVGLLESLLDLIGSAVADDPSAATVGMPI